ncbi:MAG: L-threonylcarbamoyladenylate synthase [Candidatus Dojkabacteria bacterium]
MKILKLTPKSEDDVLTEALKVLHRGGLIVFPTETAYGAGVLATSRGGVSKLLDFKRRPPGKAISVAVSTEKMAGEYVKLNSEAKEIYKKFLPGPVTVISKNRGVVDVRLISERKTLGIRIPDHDFVLRLIRKLGEGITATSANTHGRKTPYSIEDILNNTSKKQQKLIDLIIDAGELEKTPTSTVIDTTRHGMQVIRSGGVDIGNLVYQKKIDSGGEMQLEGEKLVKSKILEIKRKSLIVLFNGELGTGKTQFTKGVAKGLGISEIVNSPTYSIINEYEYSGGILVHMDAWRLESFEEFLQLDIASYIKPGNVIAVEWSGSTEEFFKKYREDEKVDLVEVEISYISESERELLIFD